MSRNTVVSTSVLGIGIGIGICIISLRYLLAPKKRTEREKVEECEIVLELLPVEREGMINAPSVATITFYEGCISASSLQSRVDAVVAHNPWLDSRLVNLPSRGGVCAVHRAQGGRFQHLSVVQRPGLSTSCDYNSIISQLDGLLVKVGTSCVDKKETLFSVVLIELEAEKKYALVVSMSHVLGDGHTFYNIYGMLNESTAIRALDSTRRQSFMLDLETVQGPDYNNWLRTPTTLFGFLFNMLGRATPFVGVYEVNSSKIQTMKDLETRKSSNEFVSTNDILTSTFFSICNSDFALLSLNFRSRLVGYSDTLAGNYKSEILYNKEDYQTATQIRNSLSNNRSESGRYPGKWCSLMSNVAVSTNWSSFYQQVSFPNATQSLHLPVLRPSESIFRDVLVIFRPAEGHTGVLFAGRSLSSEMFLKKADSFLGISLLKM